MKKQHEGQLRQKKKTMAGILGNNISFVELNWLLYYAG